MKRVIVIGAGARVMGAVLPALWCLRDRFAVEAVVSRNKRTIALGPGAELTTSDSPSAVDYAGVDLIVVAVTPSSVPRVLDELVRRTTTTIMLDTPVVPPTALRALRRLSAFRRVVVAEDTIALPPFVLARRLIDDGVIGSLRRILFFHCGFKYHALASLKMLANARAVRTMTSRKYQGKLRIKDIELDNGVTAVMYEPRDYTIGKFLIEGDRGCIADYECARDGVRRITYDLDGAIYRGLRLDGAVVPATALDQAYLSGISADVPDATLMNTMKIRGLVELLDGVLRDRPSLHYSPVAGVCDNFQIRLADRVGYVPAGSLTKLIELLVGFRPAVTPP